MGIYKRITGIYMITCIEDKKVYIGSSLSIKKRWAKHKNELRGDKHDNQHLQSAWNLKGESSFVFSILEETEDLIPREKIWVELYNACDRSKGYNKCIPGEYPKSPEPRVPKERSYVELYQFYNGERTISSFKLVEKSLGLESNKLCEILAYWRDYPMKSGRKSWKGYTFVRVNEFREDVDYGALGNSNRKPWMREKKTNDMKSYMKEYDKIRYRRMKDLVKQES